MAHFDVLQNVLEHVLRAYPEPDVRRHAEKFNVKHYPGATFNILCSKGFVLG